MAIGTPFPVCSGNGSGAAALAVPVGTPVAAGEAIVVGATCDTGTITGVTDSAGNTYSLAVSNTAQAANAYTFYALNAAALGTSGTITVTFSSSAASQAMQAWACAGIAHSGALDIHISNSGAASAAVSSGSSGALASAQEWMLATTATGAPGRVPYNWSAAFSAAPGGTQPYFGGNTGANWPPPCFQDIFNEVSCNGVPYLLRDYRTGDESGPMPTAWNDGLTGPVSLYGGNPNVGWMFSWKCSIPNTLAGDYDSNITSWAHSCQNYWDANVSATNPQPIMVSLWHEADSGHAGTSDNYPTPAQVTGLHSYVYPKFKAACAAVAASPARLVLYGQIFTGEGARTTSGHESSTGYKNGTWLTCPSTSSLTTNLDFYCADVYQFDEGSPASATVTSSMDGMYSYVPGAPLGLTEAGTRNWIQGRAQWFSQAYSIITTPKYNSILMLPFFNGTHANNAGTGFAWVTADTASIKQLQNEVNIGGGSQQYVSQDSSQVGPVVTVASQVVSSTAAQTASATLDASTDWAVTLISLKSATTGQGASLAGKGTLAAGSEGTFQGTASLPGEGTLLAGSASAPVAYEIGVMTAGGPSSSFTTQVIGVATATRAGDGFVVGVSTNAGTVTGVTDSAGNTWTLAASATSGSPDIYAFVSVQTTPLTTSGTITVAYSGATGATTTAFAIGVPGAVALDQAAGAVGTSAAPSVTTGALAQQPEAAVMIEVNGNGGGGMLWGAGAVTIDGTLHTGVTQYSVAACEALASTAPFTASGAITSAPWSIIALTFTYQTTGLQITTGSLPGGVAGVPYSAVISASGGTPPYSFAITSGALPDGYALNTVNSQGIISGNTDAAANVDIVVQVTDSA